MLHILWHVIYTMCHAMRHVYIQYIRCLMLYVYYYMVCCAIYCMLCYIVWCVNAVAVLHSPPALLLQVPVSTQESGVATIWPIWSPHHHRLGGGGEAPLPLLQSHFRHSSCSLTLSGGAVVMLCYVMLCYVMLCYAMLCYVMLCYVVTKRPSGWRGRWPGVGRAELRRHAGAGVRCR